MTNVAAGGVRWSKLEGATHVTACVRVCVHACVCGEIPVVEISKAHPSVTTTQTEILSLDPGDKKIWQGNCAAVNVLIYISR